MNKEMIISSNGHETRVAILEDDQVAEIFVERERIRGVVGNVYKGRVSKVLPGMQSAFVDLGLERDGFLYVSDVIADLDEDVRGRRRRRRSVPTSCRTRRPAVAAGLPMAPPAPTAKHRRRRQSGAAGGRGRRDRERRRSARPSRRSKSC